MNEHLLHKLPATYPQHERRILVGEDWSVSYCTVCAWYIRVDTPPNFADVLTEWAIHLDAVTKEHFAGVVERDRLSPQPTDGELIATMQYDADGLPTTAVEHHHHALLDTPLDTEGHPV